MQDYIEEEELTPKLYECRNPYCFGKTEIKRTYCCAQCNKDFLYEQRNKTKEVKALPFLGIKDGKLYRQFRLIPKKERFYSDMELPEIITTQIPYI